MNNWKLLLAGACTIIFFQNCDKANFSTTTAAGAVKSAGVPAAGDGSQIGPVTPDDPEDGHGQVSQPADPSATPSPSQTPAPSPSPAPGDEHGGGSCHKDPSPSASPMPQASSSGEDDVCILNGPGESVKLGVSGGTLGGQNPVPAVLCMTQNACLNIASKKFSVKAAEFRGYCRGPANPNVMAISDADLQKEIDQMK